MLASPHAFFIDDSDLGQLHGYMDLVGCKWMGDDKMVPFLAAWEYLEEMVPDDDVRETSRRDILRKHMEKSKALEQDMAYYRRLKTGHPDRSVQWLRATIERHIENQHRDKILKGREEGTDIKKLAQLLNQPAMPAVPRGADRRRDPSRSRGDKDKDKDKKKDKDKDKKDKDRKDRDR